MLAINLSPSFVHAAAYEDTSRADFAIIEPILFHAMLFRSTCNLSAPEQVLGFSAASSLLACGCLQLRLSFTQVWLDCTSDMSV